MKQKVKDEIITQLENKICELEQQLYDIANDNGSIIVKQLPSGEIELNGKQIDNTTEVEYYNSSKATYGELTMFRIGKEAKQREMDKLISMHMEETDCLNLQISKLQDEISMLENKSKIDNDTIAMYKKSEEHLKHKLDEKFKEIDSLLSDNEQEKQTIIERYEGMITALEEDIKAWKERYLKINNITITGNVITKYGEIKQNNEGR